MILPLIAAGKIKPLIDRVFPFAELPAAKAYWNPTRRSGRSPYAFWADLPSSRSEANLGLAGRPAHVRFNGDLCDLPSLVQLDGERSTPPDRGPAAEKL